MTRKKKKSLKKIILELKMKFEKQVKLELTEYYSNIVLIQKSLTKVQRSLLLKEESGKNV